MNELGTDYSSGDADLPPDLLARTLQGEFARRSAADQLLGLSGPRYQLWPERLAREAVGGVHAAAQGDPNYLPSVPPTEAQMQTAGAVSAFAGGGMLPGMAERGSLGVLGGRTPAAVEGAAPTFYSKLSQTIADSKLTKAPGTQWLGTLKNAGVKDEELQWTGMDDWLKEQPGNVTKEDALRVARNSAFQLQQIQRYGEQPEGWQLDRIANAKSDVNYHQNNVDVWTRKWNERYDTSTGRVLDRDTGQPVADRARMQNDYDTLMGHIDARNYAQADLDAMRGQFAKHPPVYKSYEEHRMPGGTNYNEFTMTSPNVDTAPMDPRDWDMQSRWQAGPAQAHYPEGPIVHTRTQDFVGSEGGNVPDEAAKELLSQQGTNWDNLSDLDKPRYLDAAKMRIGGREKILHVEEVQSDLHQKGAVRGYIQPGELEAAQKKFADISNKHYDWMDQNSTRTRDWTHVEGPDVDSPHWNDYVKAQDELEAVAKKPPEAPFKTNWHDLAMKSMVRYAAENGYDRISWPNGSQVAHRNAGGIIRGYVTPKFYQDLYDAKIPQAMGKLGKKYGAKVEQSPISPDLNYSKGNKFSVRNNKDEMVDVPQSGNGHVWSMKITPEMKKAAINKGFPLFEMGVPLSTTDGDGRKRELEPVEGDPFERGSLR